MNNYKNIRLYFWAAFLCIIFLSVGYSSFSSQLSIEGIGAVVSFLKSVRIDDVTSSSFSSGVTFSYLEFTNQKIQVGLDLPDEDSYIILDTSMVNLGNVEVGLKSISNLDPRLKYELIGYKIGSIICDDGSSKCKNGVRKDIQIKVSYKDASAYNSENTFFPVDMFFEFDEMYKITMNSAFAGMVQVTPPEYIIGGSNLVIPLKNVNEEIVITMRGVLLIEGIDYTIENNTITINNVIGPVHFGTNTATGNGISISTNWLDDSSVEITINGTASSQIFMRIYKGDLKIYNSASGVYSSAYAQKPLFKEGSTIYISYEPISGTMTGGKSFTVKLRDASDDCLALGTAELIANTSGKTNFYLDQPITRTGKLTTNSAFLSVWSTNGNTFNNFKFRLSFGVVNNS